MVADANYGVPLAHLVTTAKRSDSPELPAVIARAEALYPWFRPSAVIADRGYDGKPNNEWFKRERDCANNPHQALGQRQHLHPGGCPDLPGQGPDGVRPQRP